MRVNTIYDNKIVLGRTMRREKDNLVAIAKYRAVQEARPCFPLIPSVLQCPVNGKFDIFIAYAGWNRKDIQLEEPEDDTKYAKNTNGSGSQNLHAINKYILPGMSPDTVNHGKKLINQTPLATAERRIICRGI
jgi:hypothetical protein